MTERLRISSGGKWDPIVGYSRAVKIGNRVYVAGTNLLTCTKWTGLDPEDATRDGGIVPPGRTYTLGINATF